MRNRRRGRRGRPLLVVAALAALAITACEPAPLAYSGNPDGPRVALLGDSITVLSSDQLHEALDSDFFVTIAAATGENTRQQQGPSTLTNFTQAAALDPDIVVINLGTNDGDITADAVLANLAALRATFAPDACYVPVTISTHGIGGFATASAHAPAINAGLPREHLADWAAAIDADPGLVKDVDGVHPTSTGADELARIYHAAVATCPPRSHASPTSGQP